MLRTQLPLLVRGRFLAAAVGHRRAGALLITGARLGSLARAPMPTPFPIHAAAKRPAIMTPPPPPPAAVLAPTSAFAAAAVAAPPSDVDLALYDAEQAKLMAEMCILVDANDKIVGFDTKKNTHLMANISPPKSMLHRAFSVFLFDEHNRLLLQQRADEKITFPAYWTNTCCSHPLNVDDERDGVTGAKTAAVRKLDHELGITAVAATDLQFLTRIHYLAPSDGVWGEHEVDYIFIARKPTVAMEPSPNEVKATRYVTRDELRAMFKEAEAGKILLTPWFRLICESFLFKWWDHLEQGTLHECEEQDKIHCMVKKQQ